MTQPDALSLINALAHYPNYKVLTRVAEALKPVPSNDPKTFIASIVD